MLKKSLLLSPIEPKICGREIRPWDGEYRRDAIFFPDEEGVYDFLRVVAQHAGLDHLSQLLIRAIREKKWEDRIELSSSGEGGFAPDDWLLLRVLGLAEVELSRREVSWRGEKRVVCVLEYDMMQSELAIVRQQMFFDAVAASKRVVVEDIHSPAACKLLLTLRQRSVDIRHVIAAIQMAIGDQPQEIDSRAADGTYVQLLVRNELVILSHAGMRVGMRLIIGKAGSQLGHIAKDGKTPIKLSVRIDLGVGSGLEAAVFPEWRQDVITAIEEGLKR